MSQILRRVAFQNVSRRSYHDPSFRKPTMDDLPVPSGSWQEDFAAKQAKYNRHLIGGVGFFVATLVVAKVSNLFFFNWAPPPLPGKEA